MSTFSTEQLHSRNLRFGRARVETRRIPVSQLGLAHVGRTRSSGVAPDAGAEVQKMGRQAKDLQESPRRRRGGGGAWRAYISSKFSGQKLSQEKLQQAAVEYAALTEEERASLREIGHAGLAAGTHEEQASRRP